MNEQVTTLVEKGVSKALAYIEQTETFVVEQAPLLVQEVLSYGLFTSLFWSGFWLLLCVGAVIGGVWVWRVIEKDGGDPRHGFLIILFGGGPTAAGFICNLFTAAKIIFAPRMYLLEQLKELL